MKNIKVFLVLFIICCFFPSSLFAFEYKEDNAAYWYLKAYNELMPISKMGGFSKYKNVSNLDEFNKIPSNFKEIIKKDFPVFISNLKNGKNQKQFFFIGELPANEEEAQKSQVFEIVLKGFSIGNILAWFAISENKPDIAELIWLNILEISKNLSENNIFGVRMYCGMFGVKTVIKSLDNYCKKDASDEFKGNFVNYLKKWPKSIYDINDAIKSQYNFQKTNIDFYGKNQKYLATLFGARIQGLKDDCKLEIIKNVECERKLKQIEGAIEFYQLNEETGEFGGLTPDFSSIKDQRNKSRAKFIWRALKELREKIEKYKKEAEKQKDNPVSNNLETKENIEKDVDDFDFGLEPKIVDYESEIKRLESQIKQYESELKKMGVSSLEVKKTSDFSKMPFDDVVKILISNRHLGESSDYYKCPENGKRTIELKNYGDESFYEITCDCGKKEDPRDDFKPDSKPMKMAKEYRDTLFEKDKKQYFDYFGKWLNFDFSKPLSDEEKNEFSYYKKPEYKNNSLFICFGMGYERNKKTFDEVQKIINDFIKAYE